MDNGTWTDPMMLGELYECAWRSLSKLLLVHVVLVNKIGEETYCWDVARGRSKRRKGE